MKAGRNHALKVAEAIDQMLAENPGMEKYFGGNEKLQETLNAIDEQTISFQQKGGVFFAPGSSDAETLQKYRDTHVQAYHDGGRPTLVGLALHQGEQLRLDTQSPEYKAMLVVATRAEMMAAATEPDYHSKNHYVDVAAMTANLIAQNEKMGGVELSARDKTLLLMTAIAHDIDHDGKGNPPGEHYKNELAAFNTILPILQDQGFNQQDIDTVRVMLLTTSPNGPHAVLKDVAKAFREGTDPAAVFDKPADPKDPGGPAIGDKFPELRVLAQDPKLAQMAAILSDADLSGSFGMGMMSNFDNSVRLSNEVNASLPAGAKPMDFTADGAYKFAADHIVGRDGFASDAGRALMNQNFMEMRNIREMTLEGDKETMKLREEANKPPESSNGGPAQPPPAAPPEPPPVTTRFSGPPPSEAMPSTQRVDLENPPPTVAAPTTRFAAGAQQPHVDATAAPPPAALGAARIDAMIQEELRAMKREGPESAAPTIRETAPSSQAVTRRADGLSASKIMSGASGGLFDGAKTQVSPVLSVPELTAAAQSSAPTVRRPSAPASP